MHGYGWYSSYRVLYQDGRESEVPGRLVQIVGFLDSKERFYLLQICLWEGGNSDSQVHGSKDVVPCSRRQMNFIEHLLQVLVVLEPLMISASSRRWLGISEIAGRGTTCGSI